MRAGGDAMTVPNELRVVLERLPPEAQSMVRLEYKRRKKSKTFAYFAWFFLGWHYLYLRRVGLQIAFWLTLGGAGIWWFVDLFRVWGLVDRLNEDAARDLMVQYKSIYGEGNSSPTPSMINVYSAGVPFPAHQTVVVGSDPAAVPQVTGPDLSPPASVEPTELRATDNHSEFQGIPADVGVSAVLFQAPNPTPDFMASLREFGFAKAALCFSGIVLFGVVAGTIALRVYDAVRARSEVAIVSTIQLNCRAEPNARGAILNRYSQGARLSILETGDGWTKVSSEGGSPCWVKSAFITKSEDPAEAAVPSVPISQTEPEEPLDCSTDTSQLCLSQNAARDYQESTRRIDALWSEMKVWGLVTPDLLSKERAWIRKRDRTCSAEGQAYSGSSMQGMVISQCLSRETEARFENLLSIYANSACDQSNSDSPKCRGEF